MTRRIVATSMMLALSGVLNAGQAGPLEAFQARLDQYVEMHRRLEGPMAPLQVTANMAAVHRAMASLRQRIRTGRNGHDQGDLLTPAMIVVLRQRVAASLTIEEIAEIMEDIEEHTPPAMPAPRVNQPLPDDAPFCFLPPPVLKAPPPLPPELRYTVLGGALIIWDHHADLVVDLAPGVFDPATYGKGERMMNP